jgi:ubiquinone/menaquinone biosynthesis C-methylase UbiE
MSSYADYSEISRDFDKTRRPVGTGLILEALQRGPESLHRMAVLDAGCGTGSYCMALDGLVGSISGVDLNSKMIALARQKFEGYRCRTLASFGVGSITALAHDDVSFDAVMVNQVLHHLPDCPREGYPLHRAAVREFARVLKPGGVLVVNTSAPRQCREGFWFYHLIPEAASRGFR